MLSRRTFIRGAAGLLVAAGAGELLLPERSLAQQFANAVDAEYRRTIWALGAMPRTYTLADVDQYRFQQGGTWTGGTTILDGPYTDIPCFASDGTEIIVRAHPLNGDQDKELLEVIPGPHKRLGIMFYDRWGYAQ